MQKTIETNTDFEVRSLDAICVNESRLVHKWYHHIKYLVTGILFGIVLVKAEIISWFRIQEMFRMQSFHMYGIIGSAILVGMVSIWLIKRFLTKGKYTVACSLGWAGQLPAHVPVHCLPKLEPVYR